MKLLKSRTVWCFIVMFIVSGVEGVRELIPEMWLPALNAALGLLGVYFRISPHQEF